MRPVRNADNLPSSCAAVTKSGNLNFLGPSGPLQACNGTALPLPLQRYLTNAKSFISETNRHYVYNVYCVAVHKPSDSVCEEGFRWWSRSHKNRVFDVIIFVHARILLVV